MLSTWFLLVLFAAVGPFSQGLAAAKFEGGGLERYLLGGLLGVGLGLLSAAAAWLAGRRVHRSLEGASEGEIMARVRRLYVLTGVWAVVVAPLGAYALAASVIRHVLG
jgi:hypothetical protein